MQESDVARLWDVVRFSLVVTCSVLLPHNLIKRRMSV